MARIWVTICLTAVAIDIVSISFQLQDDQRVKLDLHEKLCNITVKLLLSKQRIVYPQRDFLFLSSPAIGRATPSDWTVAGTKDIRDEIGSPLAVGVGDGF